MFEPRPLPTLPQRILIPENLRDAAQNSQRLIRLHKCIQSHRKVRISRKPATHAQRITNFAASIAFPPNRRQSNIINFRIRTPNRAASNRNFEFSRQVIEVVVRPKQMRSLQRERRRIHNLIRGNPRQRATGNVSHHVAASALRAQPHSLERLNRLGNRFDGQPMKLNILTHRKISHGSRMSRRKPSNRSKLLRTQQSIRNRDPQHKIFSSLALATLSSLHARAVPLRVNPPPFEISARPLRQHRSSPASRKRLNFLKRLPRIFLPFQPLDFLRLRFLRHTCIDARAQYSSPVLAPKISCPPKTKNPPTSLAAGERVA